MTTHGAQSPYFIPLNATEEVIDGEIVYSGVSAMDEKVCSAVLCNYSKPKEAGDGNFMSDTWYFMTEFDDLCGRALKDYPYYEKLIELKIDGKQNLEIQELLQQEFGIKYSIEYLSSLWRHKIPKLIAN